MIKKRCDNRLNDQLRSLKLTYDVFTSSVASVLFELGNTKVLCTVSIQHGVPPFLRGKGAGWLTAEYALLPNSTSTRTVRESSMQNRNGRSVEISRFISRVLRTVVNLSVLGEQTIYVDCDVLQADGGTRAACITAASLALQRAQGRWLASKKLHTPFIKELAAAISVGVCKDTLLLDPDYLEDSQIDADFNIVATQSNLVIEIQGGAEKNPISWQQFDAIRMLAVDGIKGLFHAIADIEKNEKIIFEPTAVASEIKNQKVPLFSLLKRQTLIDS